MDKERSQFVYIVTLYYGESYEGEIEAAFKTKASAERFVNNLDDNTYARIDAVVLQD